MAETHKSKYKKPENKKPTYRKDLKDYTCDDKGGKLNPYSTGKKQDKVPRKIDKPTVDDSKNLTIKMSDNDRLYKDVETGDYDPKHVQKVLSKRQDVDSDEYLEKRDEIDHGVTTTKLKERINKLTPEQKEKLVREYIRRKIVKVLKEQNEPTPTDAPEEDLAAEIPTPEAPPADPAATPPADPTAAPTEAPAPEPPPAATDPTAAPTETPAAPTPAPAPEPTAEEDPEEQEKDAVKKITKALERERGNIGRIETIAQVLNKLFKDAELADTKNFYKLLNKLAVKKLSKIQAAVPSNAEETKK